MVLSQLARQDYSITLVVSLGLRLFLPKRLGSLVVVALAVVVVVYVFVVSCSKIQGQILAENPRQLGTY